MAYRTRNQAAAVSLTATPPRARRMSGKWVRWNRRMKAEFLDALAATCNVTEAAAAIGVDPVSVYALRRRNPEFLREWALALEQGYQLIETLLLGHVLAGGAPGGTVPRADRPALDVETGIRLLNAHRASVLGPGLAHNRRGGPKPQRAGDAETDAAILRKLDAIDRRHAADEAAA